MEDTAWPSYLPRCFSRCSLFTPHTLILFYPLQNTLMELWSLMHFVMPTVFNDRESFAAVYK